VEPIDLTYNAIVYLEIDETVAKAFRMNATVGDSSGNNITPAYFLTTMADVVMNPYQDGIVQDISTGCDTQTNLFYNSMTLKGATNPTLASSITLNNNMASDHINGDYLGFLGYQCFGNVQACNLFTPGSVNEYASKFAGYDVSLNIKIQDSLVASDEDSSTHPYESLCYKIYQQLVDNVPHRFDASYNVDYKVPETVNEYYLPIQVGDVFQFRLTFEAAVNQPRFGVETGAPQIETRRYLINAIVGQSAPGVNQANAELGNSRSPPNAV
jgi:hypothetical protein